MRRQQQRNQQNNNHQELQFQCPDQITSTAQFWPNTPQLRDRLALPLAISVTPFQQSEYKQTPVARCQSCKAFLNKFCKLKSQNQYQCSICGCLNISTVKININSLQLTNLSYSCLAPGNIQIKNDSPYKYPLLAFLLDISSGTFTEPAFFLYSTHLIKDYLTSQYQKIKQNSDEDVKIMIIAFDKYVHEFRFNQNGVQQIKNTVLDLNKKLVVSKNAGHIVKLSEKYEDIIQLLNYLQSIIKQSKNNSEFLNNQSQSIFSALYLALELSNQQIGKIFTITSISNPLKQFKLDNFAMQKRSFFSLNESQCIHYNLRFQIDKTQMSLTFLFATNSFINMMPYYIMAKKTNGQIRSFLLNQKLQFFYQLRYLLNMQFNFLKHNAICKIRYTTGLKCVGMFGNFKSTKTTDQIQLLSCPTNRRYVFEFLVKGKINQRTIFIQFSFVYIFKGKRYFKVINISQKISDDIPNIIKSIDYLNVSYAYLRAMAYNLDTHNNSRSLQIILEQKCEKHIFQLTNQQFEKHKQVQSKQKLKNLKVKKQNNISTNYNNSNLSKTLVELVEESQSIISLNKNEGEVQTQRKLLSQMSQPNPSFSEKEQQSSYLKNSRPYTLMAFYLLRHAIFQIKYQQTIAYDKTVQMRNKLSTLPNAINKVWPVLYAINQEGYQIIEAFRRYIDAKATIALVADCGDRCFLFLKNRQLKLELQRLDSTKLIDQLVNMRNQQLSGLLSKLKKQKDSGYLPVYILRNINQLILLDQQGPYGYSNFITNITKNHKQNNK